MKILIDVNMSPLWAPYLRSAGHDATHWTDIGDATADDTEIMGYARDNGCVILTRDLDFGTLLAASDAARPSVLQIRGAGQLPQKIGPRVIRLLEQASSEFQTGAVVSMDLGKTRVRLLPLRPQ